MNIKIKEEYISTIIGYNGSALPLGKRNNEELIILAEIAHNSNSEMLKNFFEEFPSIEEIKEFKAQDFIQKVKNVRSTKKKSQS
ncbi:hypothetical protein ETU09_05735 [Apibacter muscae]|uniref:Uncharacterized protein n=1 Tax=Apibacter muscae TaxID=2509004 RepID=A0A563DF82_9FLAO|nr:hypothetical protein [Apibacter muscae]TWP28424.1 hypothetical protein ETU09_05735 [Apibacter muscae]